MRTSPVSIWRVVPADGHLARTLGIGDNSDIVEAICAMSDCGRLSRMGDAAARDATMPSKT